MKNLLLVAVLLLLFSSCAGTASAGSISSESQNTVGVGAATSTPRDGQSPATLAMREGQLECYDLPSSISFDGLPREVCYLAPIQTSPSGIFYLEKTQIGAGYSIFFLNTTNNERRVLYTAKDKEELLSFLVIDESRIVVRKQSVDSDLVGNGEYDCFIVDMKTGEVNSLQQELGLGNPEFPVENLAYDDENFYIHQRAPKGGVSVYSIVSETSLTSVTARTSAQNFTVGAGYIFFTDDNSSINLVAQGHDAPVPIANLPSQVHTYWYQDNALFLHWEDYYRDSVLYRFIPGTTELYEIISYRALDSVLPESDYYIYMSRFYVEYNAGSISFESIQISTHAYDTKRLNIFPALTVDPETGGFVNFVIQDGILYYLDRQDMSVQLKALEAYTLL